MNEKFYCLPEEKQQRIINAGFLVFSDTSYRRAPVSDVAKAAGISKALLFHYFKNKKEFYLFLWGKAVETGTRILNEKETEDNPGLSSFGWIYFAGSTGTGGRDPYGDPG